jgi:uncharacterized membrane protein
MAAKRWKKLVLAAAALGLVIVWTVFTPAGVLGKADAVGYAVCHRIPERSYHLMERPLPLCARCTGQFLGMLLGLVFQAAAGWKKGAFPGRTALSVLGGLGLFYLLDGVNSFLSVSASLHTYALYPPHNALRLITGMGMGIALSALLFPLANQLLWTNPVMHPPLETFAHWAGLGAAGGLLTALITTEIPLLLYWLALFSTAGVLALLTLSYLLIAVILFQRENTFIHPSELTWWGMGGLTAALLQIAMLDGIRYLLTGTWAGF